MHFRISINHLTLKLYSWIYFEEFIALKYLVKQGSVNFKMMRFGKNTSKVILREY